MNEPLTYTFEIRATKYCLIFSDGLVLENDRSEVGTIDYHAKSPMVLTNFSRQDKRWTRYCLWSNGSVEAYELKKCACLLPHAQSGLSPVDYEMYLLLFQNWTKKGKLEYLSKEIELDVLMAQFDNNEWLSDTMHHEFKCKACADILALSLDTYRGGGKGFYRIEKE